MAVISNIFWGRVEGSFEVSLPSEQKAERRPIWRHKSLEKTLLSPSSWPRVLVLSLTILQSIVFNPYPSLLVPSMAHISCFQNSLKYIIAIVTIQALLRS
jgi:hypothetical protein